MIQEVEHKLFAILLRKAELIPSTIAKIPAEAFSSEQARWLYTTISNHFLKFGTNLTPGVLRTILNESFEGTVLDEHLLYCRSASAAIAADSEVDFLIDRVLNGRTYRDFLSALQSTASAITPTNANDQLSIFEERIAKIRMSSGNDVPKEHDLSVNVLERIKNFDKTDEDALGIPTPITQVNEIIGGLKKSQLIVISAPSGDGKSQVKLQFADYAHQQGKNVVFVTLEMSYRDLESRFHSLITEMDAKKILMKSLNPEEKRLFYQRILKRHAVPNSNSQINELFKKDNTDLGFEPTEEEKKIFGVLAKEKALERFITQARAIRMKENHFFILDSPNGMDIPKLRSHLRNISNKFPIDLIVIDYINILGSGQRGLPGWEDGKFVSRALKQIAREYVCPVLTSSQLNEVKDDEKISKADQRYSKAINENADYVIAFRRTEKDKMMGIIRLEFIKHRSSEAKIVTVRERFKTSKIENMTDGPKL